MKNKKKIYWLLFVGFLLLAGCGSQATEKEQENQLTVVATNSILADMAKEIGKEHVVVHSIVPVGTDPHEHEVLPEDIKKASDADVILYNGLNLETGNGWFMNLMETAKKEEGKDYFAVSKKVTPLYLAKGATKTQADPHAWLDLSNGMKYVEEITRILSEKDEDNQKEYEKNSKAYIEQLKKLDQQAKDSLGSIEEDKRLLVTSEGAFKYFSKAYDVPAAYIWEINTESQGTPEQMKTIVNQVRNSNVPVLFVETSVDPRSMERVAKETGLTIYDKLYTDSIDKKGEKGDSYYKMMQWNIQTIHDGLSQEKPEEAH
ncbi:metal ABC transporter substrate-binding protein [Enterococcus durans]|uniref:metal ABC transporter substrate-binding protein n=1 Tax=Enterococcus durans TaxID=53345 RepID=UPI00232BE7A6|nr:metal ABC transporter substrate-binding protein [Enterococcus durans]WCG28106.1 metal ABC transporter substrate-binding protein [Enterococcus durans]WCG69667.1 metal ABC transporter substrate-binding protein [Enterococcus durans]